MDTRLYLLIIGMAVLPVSAVPTTLSGPEPTVLANANPPEGASSEAASSVSHSVAAAGASANPEAFKKKGSSFRHFEFKLCPFENEPAKEIAETSDLLKSAGSLDRNVYFLKTHNEAAKTGKLEEETNIAHIFSKLFDANEHGSFSLFLQKEHLARLGKEYNGTLRELFPYELQYHAVVWPNEWIELRFKPLLYIPTKLYAASTSSSSSSGSANGSISDIETSQRLELQKILNIKNADNKDLTLNLFRYGWPLAIRNTLDKDFINDILNNPTLKMHLTAGEINIMTSYFSKFDIITYEDLRFDLTALTEQLKIDLQDRPYIILFINNKSSQWLAEMALPILGRAPETYMTYWADTGGGSKGRMVIDRDTPIRDFVLFDDFAYGGSQIYSPILRGIVPSMPPGSTFHLVVPYVSESAKKLWKYQLEAYSADKQPNNGQILKLLNVDKKWPTMGSFLKDEGCRSSVFKAVYAKFIDYVHHEYRFDLPPLDYIDDKNTLAVTEWKIADVSSIGDYALRALSKEQAQPIYKVPIEDRKIIEQLSNSPEALLKCMAPLFNGK